MEITRAGLLKELLQQKLDMKRKYSKNENSMVPAPGYEALFDDMEESCELLREMITGANREDLEDTLRGFVMANMDALTHPVVQNRIREWQKSIMERDGRPPERMTI